MVSVYENTIDCTIIIVVFVCVCVCVLSVLLSRAGQAI